MRRFFLCIITPGLFALAALSPVWSSDALKLGDVLNQENWQLADGLIPPEILELYKRGDYRSKMGEWPEGIYRFDPAFKAATEANRGRFTVDEQGTIIDKKTGRQPPYIYGFPFPDIDPADPRAAVKILWNHHYQQWEQGNYHYWVKLIWLSRGGVDREATQDVNFLYYDAQRRKYLPPSNPHNLLMQFLAVTMMPADLQGTAALTWRYRDADKRDAVWAYVPALRRVRAVSPANRSDGFLGSDMSQDDGPFFDGKPQDFRWKLIGEKEMLRIADPYTLEGYAGLHLLPGGGWRAIRPQVPFLGYQDPRWEGVAWAPLASVLVKRRCWVIEAVPKDRYYLYGRIVLSIDKETYQGAWNRKFDWKGELLNTFMITSWQNHEVDTPEGKEYLWGGGVTYYVAYNVKMSRATAVSIPGDEKWVNDRRTPVEPGFFDYQSLLRFGK